jgi:hypothetical protein
MAIMAAMECDDQPYASTLLREYSDVYPSGGDTLHAEVVEAYGVDLL